MLIGKQWDNHNFACIIYVVQLVKDFSYCEQVERKDKFLSTIWGPTCDAYDFIIKDTLLEEFFIGDWMVWRNMGAYTISLAGDFNGIQKPDVYPFIRKSDLLVQIYRYFVTAVTYSSSVGQIKITCNYLLF